MGGRFSAAVSTHASNGVVGLLRLIGWTVGCTLRDITGVVVFVAYGVGGVVFSHFTHFMDVHSFVSDNGYSPAASVGSI